MTGDEATFLRAIAATPDDDLPRLVYADWLDERGDPRGEFIRLQIKRAGLAVGDDRQTALALRERALLDAHGPKWRLPFDLPLQEFRRGFVDAVEVRRGQFAELASRLFELVTLSEVRLASPSDEDIEAAQSCTFVRRLRTLELRHLSIGTDVAPLLGSPNVDHLRTLRIVNPVFNAYLGPLTVAVRSMSQLTSLTYASGLLGDAGTESLANAPNLFNLTSLNLPGEPDDDYEFLIHAAGAGALARSRFLTNLESLDLSHNHLGDGGLASLAMSGTCAALESLVLTDNDIGVSGDVAIERLCESPYFDSLKHLDLRMNHLGREARQLLRRRFGDVLLM